jgi:hypothetical protein
MPRSRAANAPAGPADCYWHHAAPPARRYPCIDGTSRVCARCCVEECAVRTPAFFSACAAAGHPTWPGVVRGRAVASKLVCLESYWNEDLHLTTSVRAFLDALRPTLRPPLQVAHRVVESARGLAHYTQPPDGLLWRHRAAWDAPIYYLALHGGPGRVTSLLDTIGPERLCDAFRGYGARDCLVYFGACSVLRGRAGARFAREFLEATGCRAVVGYRTEIDWIPSMLADLLFFQRFYSHADPWRALRAIHASVRRDFRPARALGLTLVLGRA